MTDIWKMPDPNDFFITIVDWDYPKRFDVSAYLNARDAWLDRFRGKYLNLTDYERWWMELRELLREYLVDCNDSDIIIGELKAWKEKAEKFDKLVALKPSERLLEYMTELRECEGKLEAIKTEIHDMNKSVKRRMSRIKEILEGEG